MNSQEIQARINKKQEQIDKINRRISKWSSQCTQEEIDVVEQFKGNTREFRSYCREHSMCDSFSPMDELHRAVEDLNDAEITMNKYKNQLVLAESKENAEKIPELMNFLNKYKQEVIKYVEENVEVVDEYYEWDEKYTDLHNHKYYLIQNHEMTEEEWKEEFLRIKKIKSNLKDSISPLVFDVYNPRRKEIYYDRLNDILDKDIEAKYWNMVEKVTKITGEITDASNLSIGHDGNLNGIIIGKDGKARLETIYAGGYNQNVIVNSRHGQILHFRLLANEVRD